jgi:hypothetical protein
MNKRQFIKALASVPFAGFIKPDPCPIPRPLRSANPYFLDEVYLAPLSTQRAVWNLVTDRHINKYLQGQVPVVMAPPGLGKSQVMKDLCEQNDIPHVDVPLPKEP